MSRWLALAEAPDDTSTPCDSVTKHDKTQPMRENQGFVTFCQLSHEGTTLVGDVDAFDERAAIAEFDGGMSRAEAEDFAAQSQGYDNVIAFKAALQRKGGAS